jgi:hypothetical protein
MFTIGKVIDILFEKLLLYFPILKISINASVFHKNADF